MPIHLTWTVPENIGPNQVFGYRLLKRIGIGAFTPDDFLTTVGPVLEYDDNDYDPVVLSLIGYLYQVQADTARGSTPFSNSVLVQHFELDVGYVEDWNVAIPDVPVPPGYDEDWEFDIPTNETLEYTETWGS